MVFYIAGTGAILTILPPDRVSPVIGLTQSGVQVANETGAKWLPLVIALGIVFIFYAVAGGVAVMFGVRSLREHGVKPKRTMRVLKDDQVWISNEAKVQL